MWKGMRMVRMPTVTIACSDVCKSFGAGRHMSQVLRGVNLQIRSGEMVAIMGRSGSGKTTLLSCLAGLEDPDAGTVSLLGHEVTRMSVSQRARMRRTDVGFVFQQYQLVPYLTAEQNVALPLRLGHTRVRSSQIRQVLAVVGMEQYATERASDLSGGEQQRIALARVLMQQPRVVMADEPTGALDTAMVQVVMQLLRTCTANGSVLLVTHDPVVAAQCDRILVLKDGVIVRESRTDDVDVVSRMLASTLSTVGSGASTERNGS